MKALFIFVGSLFLSLIAPKKPEDKVLPLTSDGVPLCYTSTSHDMAALAADPAFQKLHREPIAFMYTSAAGEMVKFAAPDGKEANGFLLKSKTASDKWLLVYQEWWGLNDYVKQEAEKYYNDLKDVNVLAIDMYDGQVATKREEAAQLVQSVKKERLGAIMQAAITYAGPKAKIASVGWCFGGGLSLQSALLAGNQAVGCVMYYGQPEKNPERLKTLNTDVLGIFGIRDKGIPPASVSEFEKTMKEVGKVATIKMYDADHAFANPSNPGFDKAATEDAYQLTQTYLKERFNK
ncbi:dienelactone hydrolase family protein [Tellurirhabdus bombi]|uniref:dienelactone hydrolase family protein n=1 Tax=Tellurirhabdus bombi TaxID=2907205 RepID=UPI001F2ADAB5|nr:dienelactone hydrolase family protein [Tellurirhabdus bombi]